MQFVSFVIKQCELNILQNNSKQVIDKMLLLSYNETNGGPSFPDSVPVHSVYSLSGKLGSKLHVQAFSFQGIGELILRIPEVMLDVNAGSNNASNLKDNRINADYFFTAAQ